MKPEAHRSYDVGAWIEPREVFNNSRAERGEGFFNRRETRAEAPRTPSLAAADTSVDHGRRKKRKETTKESSNRSLKLARFLSIVGATLVIYGVLVIGVGIPLIVALHPYYIIEYGAYAMLASLPFFGLGKFSKNK